MTAVKVRTADLALALAGGVLAAVIGWRPGILPAWFAVVPIGLLILQNLVLLPFQVLIAREGWLATRYGRQIQALLAGVIARLEVTPGPRKRDSEEVPG